MNEQNREEDKKFNIKEAMAFSSAQISDIIAYQAFTFLIFTYYGAIVLKDAFLIGIGMMIWSVWNALNDPMLGYLSDNSHTKYGRRIPWIMFSLIPLSIIMILLFTPPILIGISDKTLNFIYFLTVIIIFEGLYTMFSINQTSLFPEVFLDNEVRGKVNNVKQTFSIIGLIVAVILPGFFIPDLKDERYLYNFVVFGIVLAIIIFIFGFIFLKWSPREREEFKEDYKDAPRFFESIKLCVKSKSFRWYIPAEIANWFIYGMLLIILPLYGAYVLGIDSTIVLGFLFFLTMISAVVSINFWRILAHKIGPRKAWMLSLTTWMFTLLPLMFINNLAGALITFPIIGIGLAGSMVLIDLVISDIVDEDEIKTGIRREASYYGVNALFMRFSTIFVSLAMVFVFSLVKWTDYDPNKVTSEVVFGLRALMFIFPAFAIGIAVFSLYNYPLDGEKLKEIKEAQKKLHEEKKSKV
ncbi:MAG: MFS transporter [Promethearchaeota archaeon]